MHNAIETFRLIKRYAKDVIGVDDLSFSVQQGEIFGFLGSNGAGKTTTIRLLLNLIFPTGGSAQIFGLDVVKEHTKICTNIGYIPATVAPPKYMSGHEFLDYMGKLSGKMDQAYQKNLLDRFHFSTKDLHRKIKEYSTGMTRQIGIVQTLQHHPQLLIMDEPTEGLDPIMQHTFYELLKEYRNNGGTVFISSHHLREVESVCDRAAIIRKGRLVLIEDIEKIMHHTTRTIHVTFEKPIATAIPPCNDWKIEYAENEKLTAKITGNIDGVIKLLSGFSIRDISLPNAGLQEVFLDYYREEGKQ